MPTSQSSRKHLIATALAIAGLLLQAFGSGLHGPATARVAGLMASGPLQSIVICTAHGSQTITVDADGNPAEPTVPRDTRLSCQLCLVAASVVLHAPASATGKPEFANATEIAIPRPDPALHGTAVRIHRNRGPPSRAET